MDKKNTDKKLEELKEREIDEKTLDDVSGGTITTHAANNPPNESKDYRGGLRSVRH